MTDPDICSLDALLGAFEKYQRRTRGLNDRTLRGYGQFVRPFIREALGDDPIDVRRLDLYVEADLAMKEAALRRVKDPAPGPLRFRARDSLLAFLEAL
jgi:hypothetical protein